MKTSIVLTDVNLNYTIERVMIILSLASKV